MKRQLTEFLKKENFEILIEKLEKKKYHTMEFGDILVKTEPDTTIYICDHCHGNCCGGNSENDANNEEEN